MRLTKIELVNWKNFAQAEALLARRVFIIGGNGVGKSNLLDAFRFLHDIAKPVGGGLQNALVQRGGMGAIRSLDARTDPTVQICVEVGDDASDAPRWRYELRLKQESAGVHRTLVDHEEVVKNGRRVGRLRPTSAEKKDTALLEQTALEQTAMNRNFRELAEFFRSFRYMHMVPQLVRHASEFQGRVLPDDPFGQALMVSIAQVRAISRKSRLESIGRELSRIMPQMDPVIEFKRDEISGVPHLQVRHKGWRMHSVRQNEKQLSDGALRLIGLLWTLLEGRDVVMLEEPEISFNEGLVKELPGLFARTILSRKKGISDSQVILTTHSAALLEDRGIQGSEVLLLTQGDYSPVNSLPVGDQLRVRSKHGTGIFRVDDSPSMLAEIDAGNSVGDVALGYGHTHGIFNL